MAALLFYLLGAMLVSALCSVLEATLMSTPISYITMREDEGFKAAGLMKKFKQDSGRPIAAILSLNTIANTIGAAGVGKEATQLFGSEWFGLVSAIVTVLILIFSEIIPKTIGTTYWKNLMGFTARTIRILIWLMYPIVVCVEFLQKIITPKESEANSISREEISSMADVAEESGELDEDENEIIQNLISMDETTATSAMTPRVVCDIAPESMKVGKFYQDKRYLHHSRIPVYAGDDEYITGYILRMEALQLMAEDKPDVTLGSIKRDIASFHEDATLDDIWEEMLEKDEQIAIIINEYGSFQGILTLEDIIETLLGDEIVDEQDAVRDMQQLAKERWKRRAAKAAEKKE
ncbi:MAG: CNNM domain-containing protein [Bacteroidales bacterium]|nr:CNNM domain-containing protein [Bacteroidales bacterium]